MIFTSVHFLIFFAVVVFLYFAVDFRRRWFLLLSASYLFYASWRADYLVLLLSSTLVSYYAALKMQGSQGARRRKFLYLSFAVNLGFLFLFKYFNFFSTLAADYLALGGIEVRLPTLDLLLPLGISFYTLQILSYTLEVYWGRLAPEKHLGIYALYVSFFPQLASGPIERAGRMLPQFREDHRFDYARVTDGLKLMLWGFFKKLVIADRLALYVNAVYANPQGFAGGPLLMASFFFTFQIYCDFSGYSDIAIGAAQVLGIRLMDNFRRPYHSKSVSEFWRRWHISLSSWLRDYVYIPLGGSRVSVPRLYLNTLVVFFVSGLWHGAQVTFIAWGLLHAFYLILASMTQGIREKMASAAGLVKFPRAYGMIRITVTFLLVSFAWIFFKANSMTDALYIISHMFTGLAPAFSSVYLPDALNLPNMLIAFGAIAFMEAVHLVQTRRQMRSFLSGMPVWVRWPVYIAIIFAILLYGIFGQTQFIYAQF